MEDKKQDVNSLEELVKTANSYGAFFANLANELSKVLDDIKAPDEEENTWEMKCPYKEGDEYYYVYGDGCVRIESWDNFLMEISRWRSGNTFPTKEAAELEAKRRNLLTRFKAFRDECNGDWNSNWTDDGEPHFYIFYDYESGKMKTFADCNTERNFHTFGYFKYDSDCRRAIELFGDEIKELFVEV